jgi:hypothetical protein
LEIINVRQVEENGVVMKPLADRHKFNDDEIFDKRDFTSKETVIQAFHEKREIRIRLLWRADIIAEGKRKKLRYESPSELVKMKSEVCIH